MRLSVYPAILLSILLLSLFVSCVDETPTVPDAPASVDTLVTPVEWKWKQPFRLTAPLVPDTLDPSSSLDIQWDVLDTTINSVQLVVRAVGEEKWVRLEWVQLLRGKCTVSLSSLERARYRFALATGDMKVVDSSAIVHIRHVDVRFLSPGDNELLLQGENPQLRWTVSSPGGQVVVEWTMAGWSSYAWSRIFDAADSVQPLSALIQSAGSCYDFRIRGKKDTRWSYIRNVRYGAISILSPKPGDVWYRFLPARMNATVKPPSCLANSTSNRFELSTDGGATWAVTGVDWLLTQGASTKAYVRVRNVAAGMATTAGPFTIIDRSAPFFQPRVGQVIRYLVNNSNDRQDTVVQNTITISVESERLTSTRTEYVCHVVIKEGTRVKKTFTGLIWLDNDARRSFSGDFAPYNTGTYPNVHDMSENEISKYGHADDHSFTYTLRREFGLTHCSDRINTEGGLYDWVQATYELLK